MRLRLLPLGALLLAPLLALPACDSGGEIGSGGELDLRVLFAAPTDEEADAVEAEWAARENPARDADSTAVGRQDTTGTLYVVEHTQSTAGGAPFTHFGLVRIPVTETEEPLPVLVYHHGGDDGLTASGFLATLELYPLLRDAAVWVAPVYRAETLTADAAGLSGTYTAGGSPSPWDYDVDDAIGLLNAALALFPDVLDGDRIGALGFSRGGNTALLHAVRDDRVDAVTDYFGPADFFNLVARQLTAAAAEGDPDALALPGVAYLDETVLDPLVAGTLSYEAARLELVRRSPGLFSGRLPDTQVHHHREDPIVLVQFSEAFIARVENDPNVQLDDNIYTNLLPDGVASFHDPAAMPESLRDTERFILRRFEGVMP
ncbi:MAG: hypothetical protein R3181_00735 [Rubricoccaceae bacterium]|nr:hypothetical protein [Rubricoccaceae bacterium]